MFRNLANQVVMHEQIVTTIQKAKEARRWVDKLVTLGKKGTEHHKRLAFNETRDQAVVEKLFGELKTRYSKRAGGYTRVLRLSETRWGDAAEMAVLELVDHPPIDRKRKVKVAAEGDAQATDAAPTTGAADPFSGMRKLFRGNRGGKKAAGAAKAEKPAKSAAKKAPAPKKASKRGDS